MDPPYQTAYLCFEWEITFTSTPDDYQTTQPVVSTIFLTEEPVEKRTLIDPPAACSLLATRLSTKFFKSRFSLCEKFLNMVDPPERTMF